MKIMIVNTGIFPVPPKKGGAIESHTYYLAKNISRYHKVHYVTDISNGEIMESVIIHKIDMPVRLNFFTDFIGQVLNYFLGGIFTFRRCIFSLNGLKYDVDIIHTHLNSSAFPVLIVKKGIPLIFTVHNPSPYMFPYRNWIIQDIRKMVFRLIDLNIIKRCEHVICVSDEYRKELIQRWKICDDKITVIPNGIDTEFFNQTIHEQIIKDVKLKYNIEGRYFLFVGRLILRKGVNYLIDAFKRTDSVDISCVIIGDGPEKENLSNLAKGSKNKIIFTGAVEDIELHALYCGADFFVLPSLSEGLPLVVLEAMSCGLPVIATDTSGVGNLVIDESNGFIVPSKNDEILYQRIMTFIKNRDLCKKYGNEARNTVVKYFNWSIISEKTIEVYKNVLEYKNVKK